MKRIRTKRFLIAAVISFTVLAVAALLIAAQTKRVTYVVAFGGSGVSYEDIGDIKYLTVAPDEGGLETDRIVIPVTDPAVMETMAATPLKDIIGVQVTESVPVRVLKQAGISPGGNAGYEILLREELREYISLTAVYCSS